MSNERTLADAGSVEELQVVTFHLGKEEFAVPILQIQEINKIVEITRVPNSPPFVEGVINLRGKVIPIIDLRKRFNLPLTELGKLSRIVVVNIADKNLGLIVDSVSEVLRLNTNSIEPPPTIVAGIDSDYIKGLGRIEDKIVILLDLNKILSGDERKALAEAH